MGMVATTSQTGQAASANRADLQGFERTVRPLSLSTASAKLKIETVHQPSVVQVARQHEPAGEAAPQPAKKPRTPSRSRLPWRESISRFDGFVALARGMTTVVSARRGASKVSSAGGGLVRRQVV